jgi:hypothetical protein
MPPEYATQLISQWWNAQTCADIPLLEIGPDGITPLTGSTASQLRCSTQLITHITTVSRLIRADWNAGRQIEGIAYLVYRRTNKGDVDPLYVGIANSSNKNGNRCSSLWGLKGARFCDGLKSNGHVDCLSRSLAGLYSGYASWVETLFGQSATFAGKIPPPLLQPVFVHVEVWNAAAHRVIHETPEAPLYVEEMHRLWVLKAAGFGPQLLNRDGN